MHRKTAVFATVLFALCSANAFAIAPRTFVASTGSDLNTCGRTDPCRSFATALLQTSNNGEVVPLDSAGYGTMSITQPVSVISPLGIHAAITASSGDAVTVSTAQFTAVALRNLYINATGATNGINVTSGGTLHVEHCLVSGFSNGILINPSTDMTVIITDTLVRQNFTAGIWSKNGAVSTKVTIDHCHIEKGGFGVLVDQGFVTASNTTADGNSGAGFQTRGNDEFSMIVADSCVASHNNTGFLTSTGSQVLVAHNCTAVDNTTGFYTTAGILEVDGGVAASNTNGIDVNAGVASIRGCHVSNNFGFGIRVQNFATASVTGNMVTRNATGLDCTGATAVDSAGDNIFVHNNVADKVCTLGAITKQ